MNGFGSRAPDPRRRGTRRAGWSLALLGALFLAGCAGNRQFQHPPGATGKANTHGEDFDPAALNEELVLIQPNFAPPPVSPADTASAGSEGTQSLVPRAAQPQVYRLQIIAFKTEDLARPRAAVLKAMLGVPVRVVSERNLFMVQAGECSTADEAEALRSRLVVLNPDYTEAYVIPRTGRAGAAAPAGPLASVGMASSSFSGWRVLIDQFLTYEEAEALQREAADRLQRTDIEINFKAPWFKVEVGRFRSETPAQELVELFQSRGYRNVLRVREQIEVQEGKP